MTANYAEQIKCKIFRLNYHFAIHTLHVNPLDPKVIRSDMGLCKVGLVFPLQLVVLPLTFSNPFSAWLNDVKCEVL